MLILQSYHNFLAIAWPLQVVQQMPLQFICHNTYDQCQTLFTRSNVWKYFCQDLPLHFNRTLIRQFIMKYKLKMQFCFTELFLMVVLNCFMISLGNHMHKLIFDKWIIYNFDLSKVLVYINKGIHIIINKHTINPFSTNVRLLYPLKTSKNLRFSDVFRGV